MNDVIDRGSLAVMQVSTADVAGGAEKIAADLHGAYLERHIDATLAVGFKFSDFPRTVEIPNDNLRTPWARALIALAPAVPPKPQVLSAPRRVARQLLKTAAEPARAIRLMQGYDDFDFPGTWQLARLAEPAPDVLHLHNLHGGYFDLRALPALCRERPVVLTAHDMWLATGHCAYAIDCPGWLEGCGQCPHLDYPPRARGDRTAENQALKRSIFEHPDTLIHLVSPSRWIQSVLERSVFAPAIEDSRVIPNGIDLTVFQPGDRDAAREAFGLRPRDRVVAFTVAGATSVYKDFGTLTDALRIVASEWRSADRLVLLVIGGERDAIPPVPEGVTVVGVPFSPDPARVALALRAADVYAHAAKAEVLGLGILEAQAVGVPAVVTRTGGAPEAVLDGRTGHVVGHGDAQAMAISIGELLRDPARSAAMGREAARFVAERFDLERMADSYLELYAEVRRRPSVSSR